MFLKKTWQRLAEILWRCSRLRPTASSIHVNGAQNLLWHNLQSSGSPEEKEGKLDVETRKNKRRASSGPADESDSAYLRRLRSAGKQRCGSNRTDSNCTERFAGNEAESSGRDQSAGDSPADR